MNDDTKQQPEDGRLPYEPPQVISEEVFETLALSCAKTTSGFPDFCTPGQETS